MKLNIFGTLWHDLQLGDDEAEIIVDGEFVEVLTFGCWGARQGAECLARWDEKLARYYIVEISHDAMKVVSEVTE